MGQWIGRLCNDFVWLPLEANYQKLASDSPITEWNHTKLRATCVALRIFYFLAPGRPFAELFGRFVFSLSRSFAPSLPCSFSDSLRRDARCLPDIPNLPHGMRAAPGLRPPGCDSWATAANVHISERPPHMTDAFFPPFYHLRAKTAEEEGKKKKEGWKKK